MAPLKKKVGHIRDDDRNHWPRPLTHLTHHHQVCVCQCITCSDNLSTRETGMKRLLEHEFADTIATAKCRQRISLPSHTKKNTEQC